MVLPAVGLGSPFDGLGMLDCGASDSFAGWVAAEALVTRSVDLYGQDAVMVNTDEHKCFQFGDGEKRECWSHVQARVNPLGREGNFSLHVADNESTPILVSVAALEGLQAIVNFGAGTAIFTAIDPDHTVSLYRSGGGHYWIDMFNEHPEVGDQNAIFQM